MRPLRLADLLRRLRGQVRGHLGFLQMLNEFWPQWLREAAAAAAAAAGAACRVDDGAQSKPVGPPGWLAGLAGPHNKCCSS